MKVESLFDFQKIAKNKELEEVITEVETKYGIGTELSDDELENVAGGIRRSDDKLAQPNGKLAQPDGKLAQPNGKLAQPGELFSKADEKLAQPNGKLHW